MSKVAVIGSNSFSGSHFVDFLLSNTQHTVIGTSRSPEPKDIYLPYRKNRNLKRFRFHRFDLNEDIAALLAFLDKEQPEIIVNYAAQNEVGPSWENPVHWYRTNALAVVALTHHLKDKKYLKRYVQISSPEIYGTCQGNVYENAPYNPSTPYAASKAAGDMFIQTLIKSLNFPATIIRSTNVYGPGQKLFKIIPKAIISIKTGRKIPLDGGGKAIKSYIHIRDACNGT
ncbi:MAG: NAD-dependent epimerase/dehydratase family protein, partial [Candidatus Aenigmatarchaeota archaeon]